MRQVRTKRKVLRKRRRKSCDTIVQLLQSVAARIKFLTSFRSICSLLIKSDVYRKATVLKRKEMRAG